MCVIVHKPESVKIDKRTVKEMFHANPHGCGLAYFADDGMVEIVKGLMDFKSAWRAINSLNHLELVIHFRWATHGPTSKAMTHPFSLREDPTESESDQWSESVLFHNGVIGRYGTADMSDTLHFCCSVLAKIDDLKTRLAVLALTHDKFAVMEGGEVYLVGHFSDFRGMLVSNTLWRNSYQSTRIRGIEVSRNDDDDDPWLKLSDGSYVRESEFVHSDDPNLQVENMYYGDDLFFAESCRRFDGTHDETSPESRIVDDMKASDIARRILEKIEQ